MSDTSAADEEFKEFQRGNLARAADHFGVTLTGQAPVFGWRLRTIGAPAHHPDHGTVWLRVVSEFTDYAHGDAWTGTLDANTITGVTKPRILHHTEWTESDWRAQRTELSTFIDSPVISTSDRLTSAPTLPGDWWTDLANNLEALAQVPTKRQRVDQDEITRRITVFWGDQIDPTVTTWTTAHGDLHWNNITHAPTTLLDWELWGTAPAGYDAATLLIYALDSPKTSTEIQQRFAHILNTHSGRLAQLHVITRLLLRIENGDPPDCAPALHAHARRLLQIHD